jgi:hypothetical protein
MFWRFILLRISKTKEFSAFPLNRNEPMTIKIKLSMVRLFPICLYHQNTLSKERKKVI